MSVSTILLYSQTNLSHGFVQRASYSYTSTKRVNQKYHFCTVIPLARTHKRRSWYPLVAEVVSSERKEHEGGLQPELFPNA